MACLCDMHSGFYSGTHVGACGQCCVAYEVRESNTKQMTTSHSTNIDVRKHFESGWGKKCSEFDPNCACCRAWQWYEGAGEEYLLDIITSDRLALLDRLSNQARTYETVTRDSLPGYDASQMRTVVPIEAINAEREAIKKGLE